MPPRRKKTAATERDPLWYKDAILYELRVRSFFDSNGDGMGDFAGLTEKLDYLQDLGVTALWLLPFYPSPLRDDGYDISDYTAIDPACGTLDDFTDFLAQAHRRGLRVVTELVLNHTSDQHPWFQRARRAPPGSRWRDFYVWSDTPEPYGEARVIFKDFEPSNWTWDRIAGAYFWHRFYSHQPDLNFDNPEVRKEVLRVLDFWFDLGVDGLRVDAVPYLYEREGTNCENLPETHEFLKHLRRHVDQHHQDRMILAEANQWSEDSAAYFGAGDECHMAFHFPIMPRLFMALHMEDRFPIVDILAQTPPIPETCQWALFLRNHDELTLEMVTDEERDYMYRVYAHDTQARINLGIRRRLAPLLGNDRRRLELMNALLFSLPGTPVLYYGDEIGMGDNFYLGDRNGVRTPMQWSGDRNAGFSRANPQRLFLPVVVDPEYHYESVNVEAQQNNPHSLLWWTKRLIALRKRYRAFGRGSIQFLSPDNAKVLAFIREYEGEKILVVANLSRFAHCAEIDLSAHRGLVPIELFGRTPFPPITRRPYSLTVGPHSFYLFQLEDPLACSALAPAAAAAFAAPIRLRRDWTNLFRAEGAEELAGRLPVFLQRQRWFGGKAQAIKTVRVCDTLTLPTESRPAVMLLVQVEYADGRSERYSLPLGLALGTYAAQLRAAAPERIAAEIEVVGGAETLSGVVYDALEEAEVCSALLELVARRRELRGGQGQASGRPTRVYRELRGAPAEPLPPTVLKGEQSNTSVAFGTRFVLKVFRRLADGVNPELEIGRFLTDHTRFPHIAPVAGALEYRQGRAEPATLALLHGYVANEGDAWKYTLDQIKHFFERALTREPRAAGPGNGTHLLDRTERQPPDAVGELFGAYLETARLLAQRTAELHLALASVADDPEFAPEPFTTLYQRSLYQSSRNLAVRVFRHARARTAQLPREAAAELRRVVNLEPVVLQTFHSIVGRKIEAARIRCHGDYHLGQVLHTGRDFVIIDFEGEPARTIGERRLKRSPLRDVAGMLRSFDYAVQAVLRGPAGEGVVRPQDVGCLEPWARLWRNWVSSAFLRSYLNHVRGQGLVPETRRDLQRLLDVLLLEKCVYELGYELDHRPEWLVIPARGIAELLGTRKPRGAAARAKEAP